MARKPNPIQSPYLMGILGQLLVEATRTWPDAMPMQKDKEAWFANQLQPGWKGLASKVPYVGSMIKASRQIINNPTDCAFDILTFDRICKMLGGFLPYVDFCDFESFKKWAGVIPANSNENMLANKGKERVKKSKDQFQTQQLFNKNAGGRALSLLYAIQEKETYATLGELSVSEVESRYEEQKKAIEELELLIEKYPEQVISESFLRQFNAAFFYGPHFLRNAVLTPKLWQSAWLMDQYLESHNRCSDEMLWLRLDLKNNLMKVAWALGKDEATQQLNRELLGLIEENKRYNYFEIKSVNPYYLDYYGYGCCFDLQRFVEFHHFTQQVTGSPRERQAHLWRSYKCTACTKLRCGQYEEVETTLGQMKEACDLLFEDTIATKSMRAYYHYLLGGSLYHQKSFKKAVENLKLAIGFWEKAEMDNAIEAGYTYYLLSETERHFGQHIAAEQFLRKAKAIFVENKKSNACSFDYQHIKNLLLGKSMR